MKKTTLDRTIRAARSAMFSFALLAALLPSAFAVDVANGQRLYLAHCAGCHGESGISIMPEAPNLARIEVFTEPDQALVDVVRDGRDAMPPYLGILKDGEILDVVGYLRTLR